MKFPRHWAKATRKAQDANGREFDLVAWGWSDADAPAARSAAQSRLERMAESVTRGGFERLQRYGYGCEVLNTERAMFVDIDAAEADALRRVEAWLGRNPDWGFRACRTKAGVRLLATHAGVDPADGERVMDALGADPLYTQLCRAQQSYRARLTPKPWRCGMRAPRVEWPLGNGRVPPGLAPVIALHDERTRSATELPLA